MSDCEIPHPTDGQDNFSPDDWLSASDTIRLVSSDTLSHYAHVAITKRAHAGLLRAYADLMIVGDSRTDNVAIPSGFWWAEGEEALTQNWELGDFETWMQRRVQVRVFGARFHRQDLRRMIPNAFKEQPGPTRTEARKEGGGRPQSPLWPVWVAELAAMIHNEGIPKGQGAAGSDDLIARIDQALMDRGLEGPSRSTVQETVKAVLARLRHAGN